MDNWEGEMRGREPRRKGARSNWSISRSIPPNLIDSLANGFIYTQSALNKFYYHLQAGKHYRDNLVRYMGIINNLQQIKTLTRVREGYSRSISKRLVILEGRTSSSDKFGWNKYHCMKLETRTLHVVEKFDNSWIGTSSLRTKCFTNLSKNLNEDNWSCNYHIPS